MSLMSHKAEACFCLSLGHKSIHQRALDPDKEATVFALDASFFKADVGVVRIVGNCELIICIPREFAIPAEAIVRKNANKKVFI